MSSTTLASAGPSGATLSTRLLFLICGFGTAAWAPLVPYVKARAGLDDGRLGLLLLCLGAGSIAALPSAGAAAARFGLRPVLVGAVVLIVATLPVLASASAILPLAVALLLFGAGMGALDCAMNLQAVEVESRAARPMMSGFHGLFSLGAIVGAAGSALLLTAEIGTFAATLAIVAGIAAVFVAALPGILPHGGREAGPAFALPRGPVLLLGTLCFIVFLTEGAMLDWSAVFLVETHGVATSRGAAGYVAFSIAMTICRLAGDAVVARLGRIRVVVLGGALAAAGLALATLVPSLAAVLAGFALVGAGCANIVPVFFTAAGRQAGIPAAIAVPAVATLGYAGILAGPAAIGFLAQATSLRAALLVVAALLVAVAVAGPRLRV